MNDKLNDKINQVTSDTLVVGMDIAKNTHYACFVDERGLVLEKAFAVSQSSKGFQRFYTRLIEAMKTHGKTEVIVGIEPTGHYWLNLAYFLDDRGIPLVITNPMHVKRSKELDDNLPTKHDRKDAMVIARLVKDGRYSYPRILKGVDAELRVGATLREKLVEEQSAVQNKMIRWTDRYFPEFRHVFPSFGKMALAVLDTTPFPEDVVHQDPDQLLDVYRSVKGMKSPQRPKVIQLIQVATTSISITEGKRMARIEITTLVDRYRQLEQQIEGLHDELTELAQTIVDYEWLSTVPGLGDATIVELLAEIGSFALYDDPRQLIKLAGLTLKESSSGLHKGRKSISKRGRKRLRSRLFRVMIPLIRHNEAFRSMHDYYTNRPNNPLRKKQSIVVLCGKLLKVLHGMCTKEREFDAKRMMADLPDLMHPHAS